MPFYAIKEGKKIGIFENWEECKEQVAGYPGAIYKKFKTKEEAMDFIGITKETINKEPIKNSNIKSEEFNMKKNKLYAFVDGSFNSDKNIGGYGLVLCINNNILIKDFGTISDHFELKSMNVLSEIFASQKAIQLALANGYKEIIICYDYEGIENWATKKWKAKKQISKNYIEFIDYYSSKIKITFMKISAHNSDENGGHIFNHEADKLAKLGSLLR